MAELTDELTLLRAFGNDVPDPDPAVLLRARRRLLRRAVGRQVARRRRIRTLVAAAAVVAVASGGVLVDTVWRDQGEVVASAAAVAVLERASRATLEASDPIVGPGQYLRVTRTERSVVQTDDVGGGSALVLTHNTRVLWIPGAPDQDWVLQQSPLHLIRPILGDPIRIGGGNPTITRAPGTEMFQTDEDGWWQVPTPEFLASLPRDPHALRERLYDDVGTSGRSADSEVLVFVADVLQAGLQRGNIVPADLRAALFEAAALVPGVEVTDDNVVLDGQRGVAIGLTEGSQAVRTELVFDRDTSQLLGQRDVTTQAGDGLAAGDVFSSSALRVDVVDQAPQG